MTIEDVLADVFRNPGEANPMGPVHGDRAALPRFRGQGDGVLTGPGLGLAAGDIADVSAYATSKFAVRPFGDCLGQESRDPRAIDVATILRRRSTRRSSGAPRTTPSRAATDPGGHGSVGRPRGIVCGAQSPKRELTDGRALELLYSFARRSMSARARRVRGRRVRARPRGRQGGHRLRPDALRSERGRWLAPRSRPRARDRVSCCRRRRDRELVRG
jgi:NAD(P)-dependent dehydrogenase (short-subunit alcohol dehydrogenase family)